MDSVVSSALRVALPGDGEFDVAYDPSSTVTELLTQVVTNTDLPRADFQGAPFPWHLAAPNGSIYDPTSTLQAAGITPTTAVRATGPNIEDIVAKRDEWLADVQAQVDGTAGQGSVHAATLLALVRRTGSSLDAAQALQTQLASPSSAPLTETPKRSTINRFAAGAAVMVAMAGLWVWVFTDWFGAGDGANTAADNDPRFNIPLNDQGSIDFGEEDEFLFGALAGDRVRIRMEAVNDFNGLDPELILYDPEGRQIARNDDNPIEGTLNSLIDIEIPEDGTYRIGARSLGGSSSGAYEVSVEEASDLNDFDELRDGQFGFDQGFDQGFAEPAFAVDEEAMIDQFVEDVTAATAPAD